jgi:hemerythrin
MQKINWASHQYDLGHTDIDQQHQQLVEIINELVDQLDQPGDTANLR